MATSPRPHPIRFAREPFPSTGSSRDAMAPADRRAEWTASPLLLCVKFFAAVGTHRPFARGPYPRAGELRGQIKCRCF